MEQFNHGAIHQPIRRKFHRMWRRASGKRLARGIGVDWNAGSQFRSKLTNLPKKNQGQNYSCGGQAGSYFIQIQRIIQGINEGEISAKSIYDPISCPGGGTSISLLMQQIGSRGANLESSVPSYEHAGIPPGAPLNEIMMTNKSSQAPELIKDALIRAGYTPYDIPDDIESVANAINSYGAVIWEITGQDGNTPNWRSPTPQPPSPTNPNTYFYHFMCAYDFGVDTNGNKYIMALQSEGPVWGNNGIQNFYSNYFTGKYLDAFTFVYDLNLVPNSDNFSTWANICRWFRVFLTGLKNK